MISLQHRLPIGIVKHSIFLLALAALAQAQTTNDATTAQTTNTATAGTATTNTQTAAASVSLSDLPNLSTAASVGASTVSVTSAPAISTTSATSSGTIFHLSDVPTIAGYGIPTAQVPWTAGAPFMQTSNLPEGTVFIVVGAFLGTLGAAILLWRALIAWSLHRSVKKAQLSTHHNDSMLKLNKPYYAHPPAMGSSLSLDRLSAPAGKLPSHKLSKHAPKDTSNRPASGMPTSGARNSSLFFSPTAGAGAHHTSPAAAMVSGNNRSSAYLPAGYYAAPGAAAPSGGAQSTSVGSGAAARLSSLNPMHPSNKGYSPQYDLGPSPPGSPALTPPLAPTKPSRDRSRRGQTGGGYERVGSGYGERLNPDAMSTLHLPGGAASGSRAPSANLEDLFEHHGNGMRGDRF